MIIFVLILSLIFIYLQFNKKQSFTEKLIPDAIHKVYIINGDQQIPNNIKNAIKTWTDLNPGYTLKIWYLDDCLKYLKQNFTQEHVDCFNGFVPYAYKADFFRYCVLYNEGGWYTDIQQVLLVPLDEINNKNYEWVSCYDETGSENKIKKCMQNSFFGSCKNNLLLKDTINRCIYNFNNKIYNSSPWDITGPCLLGEIFKTSNLKNINIGYTFNDSKDGPCFNINNKKVIINKCCVSKDIPGSSFKNGNNYVNLWKNKSVFKSKFTNVESSNKDMCILLTTCVDVKAGYKNVYDTINSRIELYNKVIKRWIDETSFDIYVVESSGYTFPEFIDNPRLQIYSFVQTNIYNCKDCSATPYEAESIIRAFDNLNLKRYPKILKVTGKYYLPGIENLVKDIPDNAQLYFQNLETYSMQNSEFFGCKTIYLKSIMNLILENSYKNMNFESTLYTLKDKYIIYKFPKIKLDKFVKRGDGSVLKYL